MDGFATSSRASASAPTARTRPATRLRSPTRSKNCIDSTGADGINLNDVVTQESYVDFVDLVVPELQRRGRYRTSYEEGTLRDKFFGRGSRLPDTHQAARHRREHRRSSRMTVDLTIDRTDSRLSCSDPGSPAIGGAVGRRSALSRPCASATGPRRRTSGST